MKAKFQILIFLLIPLLFACMNKNDFNTMESTATLDKCTVHFQLKKSDGLGDKVVAAKAIVTANDMDSICVDLIVSDSVILGIITDIPAGNNRKFEILTFDISGNLSYYGMTIADITPGAVANLLIVLYPVDQTGSATITGYFAPGQGDINTGLAFDGYNDFVIVKDPPEQFNKLTALTIEAKIKLGSYQNDYTRIIERSDNIKDDRIVFAVLNQYLHMNINGISVTSSHEIPLNEWTHVAGVFTGQEIILFIDGKQSNYTVCADTIDLDTNEIFIGNSLIKTNPFNGCIDEIRIWSVSKDHDEIRNNIDAQLTGDEPNLLAVWTMNEGMGQLIIDKVSRLVGYLGNSVLDDEFDPVWDVVDDIQTGI